MSKSQLKMAGLVGQDDPILLIQEAKQLAEELKNPPTGRRPTGEQIKATKTQVRRLFGTLQQIEMRWQTNRDDAFRDMLLFKPRMVYQASRHEALKPLIAAIEDGIDEVSRDKNDRKKLKRLVQFFEATVAYYVGS